MICVAIINNKFMKQFGLFAVFLALALADLEVHTSSRGWGTAPTFSSTTDQLTDPCEYINQQFHVVQNLQCEVLSYESNDLGEKWVLGQSYEGVVIEPARMKVNRNPNGETVFSGLIYTMKPNQRGIISNNMNGVVGNKERPQGI